MVVTFLDIHQPSNDHRGELKSLRYRFHQLTSRIQCTVNRILRTSHILRTTSRILRRTKHTFRPMSRTLQIRIHPLHLTIQTLRLPTHILHLSTFTLHPSTPSPRIASTRRTACQYQHPLPDGVPPPHGGFRILNHLYRKMKSESYLHGLSFTP